MSQGTPIQIVNEADEPVGSATKRQAQKEGLIHRIIQVIVSDPDGRILLQKRSAEAELHPGCWDTSVGGHVDENEDYLTAARREMLEEIGLKDIELQVLGKYRRNSTFEWRQLNRYYKVYKAVVPAGTKFRLEPEEVSEVRWFTLDEVRALINGPSGAYTDTLAETINRFYP